MSPQETNSAIEQLRSLPTDKNGCLVKPSAVFCQLALMYASSLETHQPFAKNQTFLGCYLCPVFTDAGEIYQNGV